MNTIMQELYESLDTMVAELKVLWKAKDELVMAGKSDAHMQGRLTNAKNKIDGFEVSAGEAKRNWQQYETIIRNFSRTSEEIKNEIAAI
jgi:hypothetical protein